MACAASSEQKLSAVSMRSCAQRRELGRDNLTHAPKAALSLQTALLCNESAGLSLVFTDTNLTGSVSDNRQVTNTLHRQGCSGARVHTYLCCSEAQHLQ